MKRTAAGRAALALGLLAALPGGAARAQAPLTTDDAAVTPRQAWHAELFQQIADLPRAAAPARSQETTVLAFAWGLAPRLEIGFDMPWIAIRGGKAVTGLGDLDLTVKWLLRDGAAGGTGVALGAAVELPTGDERSGLGSGATDADMNLILERRLGGGTVARANLGVQFTGNTLTGAVGSRDRGRVLSAGASLTRDVGPRTALVGEVTGYQGRAHDASDRELRLQAGLVFAFSPRISVAATAGRGWMASPPWTAQIGVVLDR